MRIQDSLRPSKRLSILAYFSKTAARSEKPEFKKLVSRGIRRTNRQKLHTQTIAAYGLG